MKTVVMSQGLDAALSPLEKSLLSLFAPEKERRANELYRKISKKKKVALSSIPVILDRLYTKGILERRAETCRGGARYVYKLQLDKSHFEKSIVENTVNALIHKFGQSALSYFNERFTRGK
ncbi:BlaI/MecI/CopY family transcriptional regulator [Candidatus Woesearchaeota archaeon]|nr:BlaI/MecI/CopY family transcriptional regulator [Candidatus Woesearchaeota archaeon]